MTNPEQRQQVLTGPILKAAFFWGSLWGIAEATIGHILHWITVPGLAGAVLFPVGVFCMIRAFRDSGRTAAVAGAAVVAASIKCVNFVLPHRTLFSVANPVLAILCESLAVAGFILLVSERSPAHGLKHIWTTSFIWRLVYSVPVVGLSLIFPFESFLDLGPGHWLHFFVLESAGNAVLISVLFWTGAFSEKKFVFFRKHQAYSGAVLFMLAVAVQVLVRTVLR